MLFACLQHLRETGDTWRGAECPAFDLSHLLGFGPWSSGAWEHR